MKTRTIVTLVVLALAPVLAAQQGNDPASQAEKLYSSGLAAVEKGDRAGAKQAFEEALRLNPGHANARFHLLQLRDGGERMAAKARELKLQKVLLPLVALDDVSLEEALNALDVMVRKESKDQFVPNFVIQDPSGELAKRPVSLQLRNVPATVALKYVMELARAVSRFEEHAILIQAAAGGGAKPAE